MIKINQKGAANLIATMAYLLISFVILALVTTSALDLISKSRERSSYETMLDSFGKLELALTDAVENRQEVGVVVNNPDELFVDCVNNKIIGKVNYTGEYKTEKIIVGNVTTYKKNDAIYFEKDINALGQISLNCKSKDIPKGKNTINIRYFGYDTQTQSVLLDVFVNKNLDGNVPWYSSNWELRKEITINHNYIDEDLYNFPVLIDINENELSVVRDDGKDIIFTDAYGNKLEREIETVIKTSLPPGYNSNPKVIDYYIEDSNSKKSIWVKTSIPSKTVRKLRITKSEGYSPNGDAVFEFFDDFDGNTLNPDKWGYVTGLPLPYVQNGNVYISGSTSYIVSKNKIYSYNRIFRMRKYSVSDCSNCDTALLVMGVSPNLAYSSNKGLMFGSNLLYTNYEILSAQYSGGNSYYRSTPNSLSNQYLIYDAIVKDPNTYQMRQIVRDDSGVLIDDSGFLSYYPSRCFQETGYLNLQTQPDNGNMYVDYVFSRKYMPKTPFVDVYDKNSYVEVVITNDSLDNLTDYQVEIPNTIIGVTNKTEGLKVEEQPIETEETIVPYYIEDYGTDKYTWVKQTIPANSAKTLKITKATGYSPNGDLVFDFFDDFEGTEINTNKWQVTSSSFSSSGNAIRLNKGLLKLSEPLPFRLQDKYIVRNRAKTIDNPSGLYGGCIPGISSSPYTASSNSNSDSQVEFMKTDSGLNLLLYAGTGTTASYNIAGGTTISTVVLDQYNVYDIILKGNSFDINKDKVNIYSSPAVNFIKNINYIFLGYFGGASTADIGDIEVDYIFVRKYSPLEPVVSVMDSGGYYIVTITNNSSEELTDYQVAIPNDVLNVSSKTEGLLIEPLPPPEQEGGQITIEPTRVVAWVKVPYLSSTQDTNIYMYFGSNISEENSRDVWDENYIYVEHFEDNGQLNQPSVFDSTMQVIATPYNFNYSNYSKIRDRGKIGDSVLCDGLNDYIILPVELAEINTNNLLTFSIWTKTNAPSANKMPLWTHNPTNARIYFGTYNSSWSRGIGNVSWDDFTNAPVSTQWTKLTMGVNKNAPTNAKFYVNNELKNNLNNFVWLDIQDFLYICGTGSYYWNGYVDEVRIEKTIRSDAWRKAEYYNQAEPHSFYSYRWLS